MKTILLGTCLKYCRWAGLGLLLAILPTAMAQNFSMTLQPNMLTLAPGSSSSFVVSLAPLAGFTNSVTLSVVALPSGVTATFSPNPITPPGTVLLTLTATENATVGSFVLDINGVGGGITNTTSSSVTVNFGLVPDCYGAFQGTVRDSQTSLPIAGATVYAEYSGYYYSKITDMNGQYSFTNVMLAANNAASLYSLYSISNGYYMSAYSNSYAVCDVTNTVDLTLVKEEFGSISGTVTIQGGGSAAGIQVSISAGYYTNTDSSGNFAFAHVPLNNNNTPVFDSVSAQGTLYWAASTNTYVQANSNSVVSLTLIPICYGMASGQVLFGDTKLPATNIYVSFNNSSARTDLNGNYTLTNVELGFDNAAYASYVYANAPAGYSSTQTNATLSTCGQSLSVATILLPALPATNYGSVMGHVYDVTSGIPLTNVYVSTYYGSSLTDSSGAYLITNILIGYGATTNALETVSSQPAGYFLSQSNVMVNANQIATQDLRVLMIQFGAVEGTVRDSVTGLPLTNVYVSLPGVGTTDANGHYLSSALQLNQGNVPTVEYFNGSRTGYYTFSTNTTIAAGQTNVVDFDLLKVCAGATIIGTVVDATTQKPISNATVYVSYPTYETVYTDGSGNFILTNITVGNTNSPVQTTVNAAATGYSPQSHTITIFCDASITTEFGAPQTAFGIIQGYVTNILTGLPLTNVFIGSQFGEATNTDSNGFYQLLQAPLGPNNSARTWTVTAEPNGFPQQTLSVTVNSNATSLLNFGFGLLTHLILTDTKSPLGTNVLFTVTLTNEMGPAANVLLTNILPTGVTFISASITSSMDAVFTTPVFANGFITTGTPTFGSNDFATLLVTGYQTITGTVTNIAIVSSSTPDSDSSTQMAEATNAVAPANADLMVTISAPATIPVNQSFNLTISVENLGPTSAPDVVLTDTLPANLTFVSGTGSQVTFNQSVASLNWDFGALAVEATATATITVQPAVSGSFTNTAFTAIGPGVTTVTDPNLANNSATATTQVTAAAVTNVTIQPIGAIILNPQTGLFEQTVQFQNLSLSNITRVLVLVSNLPAQVTLYNASGFTNGLPYVEYDQTIAASQTIDFLLEYYSTTRLQFNSTNFIAIASVGPPPMVLPVSGTLIQLDTNYPVTLTNNQFIIEFASVPGGTYVIQYSTNGMSNWLSAVPPIVAPGTRVQWIDAGPPKTVSPPGSTGSRYYRIYKTQ
jgi:uncharacterized repeat protein (TIGR01451 family)